MLDNCEHVIDAAANLAETLTRLCPRTTIVATSREVLRIDGESVYRVPPLDVPAAGQAAPDTIMQYSAVELFVARTKALNASFSPHAEDLASIAAICRRLDGMPLAIELAAASAAALGIAQVSAGLRDRFAIFTRGRRTALPRQRTLRATLDWSYELLPETERRLLRRPGRLRRRFHRRFRGRCHGGYRARGGDGDRLHRQSCYEIADRAGPGARSHALDSARNDPCLHA